MRRTKISSDKVRIGQIRYFDMEKNSTEIPEEKAYAFLVNINGSYINPFSPLEEVPVYDRTPYANYTSDGEAFGTKIQIVNGEVQEGKCYVLEPIRGKDIFNKEIVTINDLENYMFKSKDFFVDRLTVGRDGRWNTREMLYRYVQMEDDYISKMKLDMYLCREEEYVKTK